MQSMPRIRMVREHNERLTCEADVRRLVRELRAARREEHLGPPARVRAALRAALRATPNFKSSVRSAGRGY